MTDHNPVQHGRKSGTRSRKPTIVIATEGERTEPDYFAYLDRAYPDVNLIIVPANDGHSQPYQVLSKLLSRKQELERRDSSEYQYWIVIDHDQRPRPELESVLQDAKANQITVADSNPCFEVWLIQHFSPLTDIVDLSHVKPVKSCDRVTNERLEQFDPEYKKGRLDSTVYMPKLDSAIENAEFDELTASELDDFEYTGSRVHNLVKQIRSDN